MAEDFTYVEIEKVKKDIKVFNDSLYKLSLNKEFEIEANDISFFNFIGKRIIFFKYFLAKLPDKPLRHFCEIIISDLYGLILSILDEKYRYVYLNERSIIENYCRLILKITVEDEHQTFRLFELLKEKNYKFEFSQGDYSLLKNEYTTSCEFIHGGEIVRSSLTFVLLEYDKGSWTSKEKNEYYNRLKRVLKFLEKMLVSEYTEFVSCCFFRRKSLLEFLLKKDILDIIFYG